MNRRRVEVILGVIATFAVVGVIGVTPAVHAHHILGIPHYAYDERYPQTPVLTYRVAAGPRELQMTGYPGVPVPGERWQLHVYVRDRETGAPFAGGITATVMRDRWIREDPVVYGPLTAQLEEAVYKFYPELDAEGDYILRFAFEADGMPWTVDLPVVVGEPGAPIAVLAAVFVATLLFLLVVRAVRIKMRRHGVAGKRTTPSPALAGPVPSQPQGRP